MFVERGPKDECVIDGEGEEHGVCNELEHGGWVESVALESCRESDEACGGEEDAADDKRV